MQHGGHVALARSTRHTCEDLLKRCMRSAATSTDCRENLAVLAAFPAPRAPSFEPKRLTIRTRHNSFLTVCRLEVCRSIPSRLETPAPDLLPSSIGKRVLHRVCGFPTFCCW